MLAIPLPRYAGDAPDAHEPPSQLCHALKCSNLPVTFRHSDSGIDQMWQLLAVIHLSYRHVVMVTKYRRPACGTSPF